MYQRQLFFNPKIANQKPNNSDACPFCVQDNLGKILDQQDDMIWVENKFPTLEGTYQTLIIESSQHLGDISNYSANKNHQLFAYAFEKWQSLQDQGGFRSVIMYRNFGPKSGGSLRHPHLQIVGLEDIDGHEELALSDFTGISVSSEGSDQAEILVSTRPLVDYTEFTVKVSGFDKLSQLADGVQFITDYILTDFAGGSCDSYNIFFYQFSEAICCQVTPRFVISPYHIGYGIHQLHQVSHLEKLCRILQQRLESSKVNR